MKRPSAALIVAGAALFVSVASTGAAAKRYLITSTNQIKPSVLAQLRGRPGPKGPTGAFNAHNLHVVAGGRVTLGTFTNPNDSGTAFATCPVNTSIVSGGYSTSLVNGHITISQPYGNGWAVTAINDDSVAMPYVQAIAVCAS